MAANGANESDHPALDKDDIDAWAPRLFAKDAAHRLEAVERIAAITTDAQELLDTLKLKLLDTELSVRERTLQAMYAKMNGLTAVTLRPHIAGIARGLTSGSVRRRSEAAELIALATNGEVASNTVQNVGARPKISLDDVVRDGLTPERSAQLSGRMLVERQQLLSERQQMAEELQQMAAKIARLESDGAGPIRLHDVGDDPVRAAPAAHAVEAVGTPANGGGAGASGKKRARDDAAAGEHTPGCRLLHRVKREASTNTSNSQQSDQVARGPTGAGRSGEGPSCDAGSNTWPES